MTEVMIEGNESDGRLNTILPLPRPAIAMARSSLDQASTLDRTQLKKRYAVYSPSELRQRRGELGSGEYLISGMLPARSLGLLIGDSGLGKSPLVYQMALCVASGKPFLGRDVSQGPVLCLDFENGLGDVDEMITGLSGYLGLGEPPSDLFLWNYNDCSSAYGQSGQTALDIIDEVKPKLVIVDSLTGLYPEIEDKNAFATRYFQELRRMMKECGTTIFALHHIKKLSNNPEHRPSPLESGNIREWFLQARGARALINGSDIRLGVDEPARGSGQEVALVVRGFGRVRGEVGPIFLCRVCNEDGEPQGYEVAKRANLLFNQDQESALARLPDDFRFKDAQRVYGKGPQATTDFLRKCLEIGLLEKQRKGEYKKSKGRGVDGASS